MAYSRRRRKRKRFSKKKKFTQWVKKFTARGGRRW